MKNTVKFKEFMAMLGEMFDKKISKTLSDAYWISLSKFSDDQCIEAFNKAIVSCRFFPKPADIIGLMGIQETTIEDRAQVVASEIISHLKVWGSTRYPKIEDPIAKYLMESRWPYKSWASQVLESELHWWVKEFCEAYRSYQITGNQAQIGLDRHDAKQMLDEIGQRVPALRAISGGK